MPKAARAPSAAATIESWTSRMMLPATKTPGTLVASYSPQSTPPFRPNLQPSDSASRD
jgi:hypothetical protein